MDEFDRRIEAYINSDLQEADRKVLCDWLKEDRAHVQRFARACFLHWQLFALGQRRAIQRNAASRPLAKFAELTSTIAGARTGKDGTAQRDSAGSTRRMAAATAAIAGVIASCAIGLHYLQRPDVVAQISKVSPDARWIGSTAASAAGAFVQEGQMLKLQRGRVLATLVSGVQVVIEGRAELRVDAANELFLRRGRITLSVPRQATGFAIETAFARFVDLGTEFTLVVDRASECELHVFSGLVELQPNAPARTDPLRVPGGRAIRFSADGGVVTTLRYLPEMQTSL